MTFVRNIRNVSKYTQLRILRTSLQRTQYTQPPLRGCEYSVRAFISELRAC